MRTNIATKAVIEKKNLNGLILIINKSTLKKLSRKRYKSYSKEINCKNYTKNERGQI